MKPTYNPVAFLLGSALLATSSSLHAQRVWDGSADNLWTNADNWTPSGAPASTGTARFDGTGGNLATSLGDVARTVGLIDFTAGQTAQVTITTTNSAQLTLGGSAPIAVAAGNHIFIGSNAGAGQPPDLIFSNANPVIDIAAGSSFEINGKINGNRSYSKTGAGTLIISSNNGGGTSWVHGGFAVQEGILRWASAGASGNSGNRYTVSSGAAIELTGGGTLAGYNAGGITISNTGIGAAGALRSTSGINAINNGTLTLAADSSIGVDADSLAISSVISGNFALTKVGAGTLTLSSANDHTGGTNVDAGTLAISSTGSTNASSAVTVTNIGSALIVDGTVNGTLNANVSTTVSGGGTIAGAASIAGNLNPGNSPGVLSFGNNLTMVGTTVTTMEILGLSRATEYDGINVGGTLAYGGDMVLAFGSTFGADATFELFDLFTDTSGSFDSVELTGSYTASLVNNSGVWSAPTNGGNETWSFDQGTGVLSLTVIPEPSAALLGSFGLLALLRRRR